MITISSPAPIRIQAGEVSTTFEIVAGRLLEELGVTGRLGGQVWLPDDLPKCTTQDLLKARARNAILLLDLNNCNAGYSPTQWQRQCFPAEYQHKLSVIFDGVDTTIWRPSPESSQRIASRLSIPPGQRIVTYVSRGMESMRGFDIFMKVAKRVCDERRDRHREGSDAGKKHESAHDGLLSQH